MNRLQLGDRCIPKDYEEWKWVSKQLEDSGVPVYRHYSRCTVSKYRQYPALTWGNEDYICGNRGIGHHRNLRLGYLYNDLDIITFLEKAGVVVNNFVMTEEIKLSRLRNKHNEGKTLTHKFI